MNKRCQLIEHHHLHDGAIHWISLKVVLILLGLLCSLLRTASSEAHSHVEASHAEHAGTVEVMDHGNTTEHAVPAALQTEESPHPAPKPETLGNLASQSLNATDPAWPEHLKLDPMFTAFPDLFTAPEIETGSVDTYRKNQEVQF